MGQGLGQSLCSSGVEFDLDLLTVNLWGLPWPFARHRRTRRHRFFDHLRSRSYDLVGIQELWWPWRRAARRAPLLLPKSRRDSGLALAGRLRLGESRVEHFDHHGGVDRLKRKGVLRASARSPSGADLSVAVVHLQASRRHGRLRSRQLDQLLGALESERRPTVLMGDFNFYRDVAEDRESTRRLESAGFRDAALTLGRCEATFVSSNPYVPRRARAERFDRVYLRDSSDAALRPLEAEVVRTERPLSDHQPLRVRVRLSA
jgi:endonuclease/exonuclease/phosphatase family metal-dependent hydrolase